MTFDTTRRNSALSWLSWTPLTTPLPTPVPTFRLWACLVLIAAIVSGAAQAQMDYREAPQLTEQVEAGALPPVAERLPTNPLVLEPVERVGTYGGTWRMGMVGGADTSLLARTIGAENLARWNSEGTDIIPNIAASFEVNDDATVYTFELREGVRWSDGEPFTAHDIMFWYEDVFSNTELTPAQSSNPVIVAMQDDTTVTFSFAEPNGLFLQQLAQEGGGVYTIYPRHYAEQFHRDYNPEGIDALVAEAGVPDWVELFATRVGGIFGTALWQTANRPTLFAWTITNPLGTGTQVVAERNPYYWKVDSEGNQLPYIDRVVYAQAEDAEVVVLRALSGEIDMQDRHIATLANRSIFFDNQERGDYRFYQTIPASMNTVLISLNLTHQDPLKRELFQNKDFRVGLSHAINREEIIDLLYLGQGEPYQAAPRPESPLYDEELAKQYTEYNVEKANEHLDRSFLERDAQGFRLGPGGNRVSFAIEADTANQAHVDTLELIQGYWREVGVDMQIRAADRSLLYTRKNANLHDAVVWGGDGGLQEVLEPRYYFPSGSESNYAPAWAAWYAPQALPDTRPEEPPTEVLRQMELFDQLTRTGDPDEQNSLMAELLAITKEQFYTIGISLPAPGYGVVRNSFRNVPDTIPNAYIYLSPALTNTSQYFIDSSSQ